MLIIKAVSVEPTERGTAIQAVADIETIIQPHDAWTYHSLTESLDQDSIKLITATGPSNNEVVGYCLYQVIFEQAEILRIGTHPKCQRQGIASKLFTVLNEELQGNEVNSLLLEVRADNNPAIALYEQQGFVIIHRRKGYYQLPHQPAIDALIMQLSYIE